MGRTVAKGIIRWGRAVLPLALTVVSVGCATAPGFTPAVPGAQPQPDSPVYRNLAEIPERPAPPPEEDVNQAVQTLTTDRATTAQAVDALRREPFATPDPQPRQVLEP